MTRVVPFSLALVRPLETAAGAVERREGLLVRVGDEPAGVGEATPLAGWTESLDDCRAALEDAGWPGDGPEDGGGADDGPDDDALPAAGDLPPMAATPAARHGLELALLDRESRRAAEPLYRRLGGDRRVSSLPVNATVGDADLETTLAACEAAVGGGFRTVKVKVGARPVEADLERLEGVRDALGDDVALRVDANGAWDAEAAATAVEGLAALGVDLVEQPLAADDLEGHAALRGRGVAVALDESLRETGLGAVLDAGAADVVVLKPMALGGVGPAAAAAERARASGVDVVVTTTVDAVVARTAAVHLAAALEPSRACGLATGAWLADDLASDPAPVVDGAISVPQSAGHGVSPEDLG